MAQYQVYYRLKLWLRTAERVVEALREDRTTKGKERERLERYVELVASSTYPQGEWQAKGFPYATARGMEIVEQATKLMESVDYHIRSGRGAP